MPKAKFTSGQRVIYQPQDGSKPIKATVMGFRPEYNIYAIKLENSEIIHADHDTISQSQ